MSLILHSRPQSADRPGAEAARSGGAARQSEARVLARPQSGRAFGGPLGAPFLALIAVLALLLAALPSWAQVAALSPEQSRPASFADLAEAVSPAVVNITTSTTVASRMDRGGPQLPDNMPFQDFFNDFFNRDGQGGPDGPGPQRPRQSQALGSGFVISADGYIVTNNHVIEGADEISIEFFSGLTLNATLVGTDRDTDIALLKVEPESPLPFVPWGDSEAARVGDWVLAVGNPLGQGFSVSSGIVSARGRALQGNYDDYLQTDAAINRGNSGGPLFNLDGEVIGVNTAILSPTGGSIGIGFAMSSNVARNVVSQILEFGGARRGWLGVRIQDVTADVAEAIGLDRPRGAMVAEVYDGPARAGGIVAGDVILSIDGRSVRDTRDLVRRVADAGVGREVEVVVWRGGEEVVQGVTLGLRDSEALNGNPQSGGDEGGDVTPAPSSTHLGLQLAPITDQIRGEMGLRPEASGLVVQGVEPGSDAESKGIRPGDLVTEVNQQRVESLADVEARVQEARDAGRRTVLVMLRRGEDPRFVALSLDR